jgi:hypothetical protein
MGGIEVADDGGFQGDARSFGHQGRPFGGGHGRPGGMRRRCADGVEAAAHRRVIPGKSRAKKDVRCPLMKSQKHSGAGGAAVPQDGTTSPRVSVAPFSGAG